MFVATCLCIYTWYCAIWIVFARWKWEQTFPSLISRKAAWMFTEASSVHPGLVYSFSATYRDSVVLWHIAELVAYRDNGSHLNEKRGTALWHSFSLQGVQEGGGGKTLTFRDVVCPPHLSLNKLVQAMCMESNKLTTNTFVRRMTSFWDV